MHARLALALLVSLLLFASACANREFADVADARIAGGTRDAGLAVAAVGPAGGGAPAAPNRYVAISGRRDTPGSAFIQNTPDVWAPFDVQIQAGFFDPEEKAAPDGVRVCLEIDTVGFDVFYLACGQYHAGTSRWQAFAGTDAGTLPDSELISGDEIELRVEQTGDDVNFYARAPGDLLWTLIDSTSFPGQSEPLKISFGVEALTKGTEVGFDGLAATFEQPPMPPAGAAAVAADVNFALFATLGAQRSLEGTAGIADLATASGALEAAADALVDAQAGAAGLPESKATKGAAKRIGKAAKTLAKALAQVDEDQDAAKAAKTLEKAGRPLVEASLLLSPQPFEPDPI